MNGENCPLKHYGFDSKGIKKQVCLGFVKGRCTYGLKCKFLHHAFDPATQTWREACVQHANYKCTRGDACPLLHVAARKKIKNEQPRSRGLVPQCQEAKYRAKQAGFPNAQWSSPTPENLHYVHRMAVRKEVLETRTYTILIRLDYAVGIDGMLGMLQWFGLETNTYDLVLPPVTACDAPGLIRFTAPEYAARFVEACEMPGSALAPARQRLEIMLKEFNDRMPNRQDHHLLLIRDGGRPVHLRVVEFLEMLRRELISRNSIQYPEHGAVRGNAPAQALEMLQRKPISMHAYPEHGTVLAEPLLKDCLNRPRHEAYDAPASNTDVGIRLVLPEGRRMCD
jgi:hypothetical protein